MGLAYKIEAKHFGFDKPGVSKYVATAVRSQTIDFDKVVEQISLRSGIAKVACRAVVETMTDAMCTWLTEGHGVSLGALGYLHPSLTCKSSEVEGEERITRKRVVFRPSVSLKQKIEAMSLDRIAADGSFVEPDGEDAAGDSTSGAGGDSASGAGGAGQKDPAGDHSVDGPTHNEGEGSHTEQEVVPETGGDTGKLG